MLPIDSRQCIILQMRQRLNEFKFIFQFYYISQESFPLLVLLVLLCVRFFQVWGIMVVHNFHFLQFVFLTYRLLSVLASIHINSLVKWPVVTHFCLRSVLRVSVFSVLPSSLRVREFLQTISNSKYTSVFFGFHNPENVPACLSELHSAGSQHPSQVFSSAIGYCTTSTDIEEGIYIT